MIKISSLVCSVLLLAVGDLPRAFAADRAEAHATAPNASRKRPASTVDPSRDSIFPYVYDGNGWSTDFVFTNLDNHTVLLQLSFFANDGSNQQLPVLGVGRTSSVSITLPPSGTISLVTGDFDPVRTTAYAFASASNGTDLFSGYAVVRNQASGLPDLEFTTPLTPFNENFFILALDNTNGYGTSVALVNSANQDTAVVSVTLQDANGNVIGTDQIPIGPFGCVRFSTTDFYPQLNGIVGSIVFNAAGGQPVTGFALRFGPNSSITAVPPFSLRPR